MVLMVLLVRKVYKAKLVLMVLMVLLVRKVYKRNWC